MAFNIVKYRLQTLILVVRDALATGAGSEAPFVSPAGGPTSGKMVVSASGKRRVRNKVDACRYVLEICDAWRAEVLDDSEDMEFEST
jgi:hypothetical protein